MPVGSLKKYMPKNKNEIIFSIIAFLLGALVSCMFLKKKFVLLEGDSCHKHHKDDKKVDGFKHKDDNKDLKGKKGLYEGYKHGNKYDLMGKKGLYEGYKHGNKSDYKVLNGKKGLYEGYKHKYGKK